MTDREKHLADMFTEICCGDAAAIQACWSVYGMLHMIDDLVDRDQEVTAATVGMVLISFAETMAANPFVQENKDLLLANFRASVLAWIDSEAWVRREGVFDRTASQVIKSQYQDFFFLVASLCGGVPHMVAMSAKYRTYHPD